MAAKLSGVTCDKSAALQVTIKGFVDNMPEWMTASDMIISKAGPGTIAESFICGLPVLLNGFVPCQEEGNVPFVLKNKVIPSREPHLMLYKQEL